MLAYAPMYNEKAENIVSTIKKRIGRLVQNIGRELGEAFDKVVFGYFCKPMLDENSPFKLLYGAASRLRPWNVPGIGNGTERF